MKTLPIIFTIAVSFILLNSCDFMWDCIEGNGRIETEYRRISDFDGISSAGSFDIYITQGDTFEVKIEADENLLSFIETEKRDGILNIKTKDHRCLNSSGPIEVFVTMSEIHEIKLAGSGKIKADSINTDELYIDLTGSGEILLGSSDSGFVETGKLDIDHTGSGKMEIDVDADEIEVDLTGSGEIELYGSADATNFSISGSGEIKADHLTQLECYASISGSGRIYVYVEEYLEVKISGSGDIYYKGYPAIKDPIISGSGSLRNIN